MNRYWLSVQNAVGAIGVSPMRISHVIKGTCPVTAELTLLIGRAFGQSPQYWLNLQTAYDLKRPLHGYYAVQ
ncbi:MAG: HigA family addiction module antitoxin [Nitrosomonas sp.]|nr:HigA family addiction module antitoxin [Nitrosomonas sp.]